MVTEKNLSGTNFRVSPRRGWGTGICRTKTQEYPAISQVLRREASFKATV